MPRGGCGKEFILIVFRIVFPAELTPGADNLLVLVVGLYFGRALLVVGKLVVDGERRPLFIDCACLPGLASDEAGKFPVAFRVFSTGNAGKEAVGGPYEGRGDRGKAVAMISVICTPTARGEDREMNPLVVCDYLPSINTPQFWVWLSLACRGNALLCRITGNPETGLDALL